MTFEELLAEGRQKLDQINCQIAANKASVEAEKQREWLAFSDDLKAAIAALLPEAVHPYLSCHVYNLHQWSYEVIISAPDCAPIFCQFVRHEGKFAGSQPFLVPDVLPGDMDDFGEGYATEYRVDRQPFLTDDIAVALAAAHERHIEFTEATTAFETRKAEVEQRLAELPVTPPPTTPTVGDQLVALLRDLVHEELATGRQEW